MQDRIGIIDLGSNTTRLIVMAYQRNCCFKLIDEVSEVVRLAEGVGEDQMLQEQPMHRAIEALKLFSTFCRATNVGRIIAAGTSALREAANQAQFLDTLKRETDLELRILSAEAEAYYSYLGAVNSLPVTDGFVIDTGGGSTQVSALRDRQFIHSFSQQAGVIRFTNRYVQSDPISKRDFRALEQAAAESFASLDWFRATDERQLIGLGGTARNLARIDQKRRNYPLGITHGYVLTFAALDDIVNNLRASTQREREAIPGLSRDRADVILAGGVILRRLMQQGNFDQMLISGQGLREGLFYEFFLKDQLQPLFDDLRGFSVQNLAQTYDYEAQHAEKVRQLSLSLFDQLWPLHGYGAWERELLGYAALIHDIGMQVGYYDHHKHSAYLVLNAALQGFNHREVIILALLARSHRKGDIDAKPYSQILEFDDEERLMRLGALLRIAEYLERSRGQVVESLHVEISEDSIKVHVQAAGDVTVEVWDANRRTRLFKKAYGKDIEIVHGA
jgi:exopolyphosphatase/guanosine-5'-triphosphate,3'-diphosphate pyrophosphatase